MRSEDLIGPESHGDGAPGSRGRPSVLAGLVGTGIQASRTPSLHEREGERLGLRYIYRLIDFEALGLDPRSLPDILAAAEHFGFAGLNITHPFKQAVIPLVGELAPDAAALGAVNTVILKDGHRVGHNTDWSGFAESFRRELPDVERDRVVQFGAGGAGAAVAHALLTLGTGQVTVIDTDQARAATLAADLCHRFGAGRACSSSFPAEALATAQGVVNTTPLGMAKYPGMAFSADLLRPDLWVSDIVYVPLETELLRQARARGCRTMSGGGMAVFQAVGAFRLFTGLEPDATEMLQHFSEM
ncbi:shikimate dehydrogenase [Microvirga sesbaniae]|uniref:shikimate dehydrogenase n=1 Tax=Microvirga sesbaniae TaxID=681392 RepID=UPI00358DB41B